MDVWRDTVGNGCVEGHCREWMCGGDTVGNGCVEGHCRE